MNKDLYRRKTCRLCDGRNLKLVLPLAQTPLADAFIPSERLNEVQNLYPLDVYLCLDCGHVQLLDVINPEILFCNYIYESSSSPGLNDHFQKYAIDLLDTISPPENSLIVDVGSNDGMLLKFFQEHGMRVLGVDPARDVARKATDSGIETLGTFFTSALAMNIKGTYGTAAIVTANNVYAHADDLRDLTIGVRHLLAPDGVFVFEVSYLVDLLQNMVFDFIYHEHLCYHSVKPFESFFNKLGMELINAVRVPTKGGSLRGIAQLPGGPRKKSSSLAELKELETSLKLDQPETYEIFAAKINGLKEELGEILSNLKREGKTIAGYGASATVTTLIYHFALIEFLDFIVDDNTERQHLFSPGHHIPVLPPQALYDSKPDYVIILAWRFARQIVRKHQSFLKRDGHFIIPVPEITII